MKIGYIALCLIVPLLWGLASTRVFDWWQARSKPPVPPKPEDADNSRASGPMYHI